MKISEYFEKNWNENFHSTQICCKCFEKKHWNQWIKLKIQCHADIYFALFDSSSRTIKYLKILPKTVWQEKVENLGQEGFQIFE